MPSRQSRVIGDLPTSMCDPPVFRKGALRFGRKMYKGYHLLFASREGAVSALNQLLRGEVPMVNANSVTTVVQLGEMCETPVV